MKLSKLGSSTNPENVSATIGGISILALAPTIVYILKLFGVDIAESEVTQIATGITTIIGVVISVFGILRKVFAKKPQV